jgi:energy-coupling factor transport system substrate-specific component
MAMKPAYRIAIIGILAAVNLASRVYLVFLPNMKPVTAIIILVTIVFGLRFGLELSVTTVLASGLVYGLGMVAVFQILAWCVIVAFTALLNRVVKNCRKMIIFAAWAFACGYIFGFFVSLQMLAPSRSASFFWIYYLNGIPFDTLHAIGNIVFYPLCYAALLPVFKRHAAGKLI